MDDLFSSYEKVRLAIEWEISKYTGDLDYAYDLTLLVPPTRAFNASYIFVKVMLMRVVYFLVDPKVDS